MDLQGHGVPLRDEGRERRDVNPVRVAQLLDDDVRAVEVAQDHKNQGRVSELRVAVRIDVLRDKNEMLEYLIENT